jgi:hypothetical protein
MIASGKAGRDQLQFLFKFPGRVTMVNLAMTYDPARHEVILLIRKIQQQGNPGSENSSEKSSENSSENGPEG